jgi:hypothetical protein
VSGIINFVSLHVFFIVEGLEAAFFVAWYSLDGLEWDDHLVGIEGGNVL